MLNKQQLRKLFLTQRLRLDESEYLFKSQCIVDKLCCHSLFLNADLVLCYMAIKNEVDTLKIIELAWNLNKVVAVPKVSHHDMEFYKINSFNDLSEGAYHILEPKSHCIKVEPLNGLIIVPGIVFDKQGYRIGYGKGYYDRYLTRYPQLNTVALTFECQVIEQLPNEIHDIPLHLLITESHIYNKKE